MASSGGRVVGEQMVKEGTDDCLPMGCLRILNQKEYDQIDYPVFEGESTIGRDESCDLSIDSIALSRTHAVLLVENGFHFIMDTGSVNKTFRDVVQLRPNAYYELTNGIELTLANICCRYFTALPKDFVKQEVPDEPESTQAYALLMEVDQDNDDATDSEDEDAQTAMTSLPVRDESNSVCGSDDTGAVSYTTAKERLGDGGMESDGVSEEDAESDPASPPLLASTRLLPTTPALGEIKRERNEELAKKPSPVDPYDDDTDFEDETEAPGAHKPEERKKSVTLIEDPYNDETDYEDETQAPDAYKPEERKKLVTLIEPAISSVAEAGMEERGGATAGGEVEPTVAYNMETDDEQDTEEVDGGKGGGARVEATVPYAVETDGDGDGGEEQKDKVTIVEPTIPYKMEDTDEEEDEGGVKMEDQGGVEPTVAYCLDSDEEVEGTEARSGNVGGVEQTVAYNLDEEEEVNSEDEKLTTPRKRRGLFLDSEQTEVDDESNSTKGVLKEVSEEPAKGPAPRSEVIEDSDETDLEGEVPAVKPTGRKESTSMASKLKPSGDAVESVAEETVDESSSTNTMRRYSFSLVPVVSNKRKGRARGGGNVMQGKGRGKGRATAARGKGRKGRISPSGSSVASEADSMESSGMVRTKLTDAEASSSSSKETFRRTRSKPINLASSSSTDKVLSVEEMSNVIKPGDTIKTIKDGSDGKVAGSCSVAELVSGEESHEPLTGGVASIPVVPSKSESSGAEGVSASGSSDRVSRRTRGKAESSPVEPTPSNDGDNNLKGGAKGVTSITIGELSDNLSGKGPVENQSGKDSGTEGVALSSGSLEIRSSPGKDSDSSGSGKIIRKTRTRQNLNVTTSSASTTTSESASASPSGTGLNSISNSRRTRSRAKVTASGADVTHGSDVSEASSVDLASSSRPRSTRRGARGGAPAATAPSEVASDVSSATMLGSSRKLTKTPDVVSSAVTESSLSDASTGMALGSSNNPTSNWGGADGVVSTSKDDVSTVSSGLGPGFSSDPTKNRDEVNVTSSSVGTLPSESTSLTPSSLGLGCSTNSKKSESGAKGVGSSISASSSRVDASKVPSELGSSTNLRKTRSRVKGAASSAASESSSEAPLGSSANARTTRSGTKGVTCGASRVTSEVSEPSEMALGSSNNAKKIESVTPSVNTLESEDISDAPSGMGLGSSNTTGTNMGGAEDVAQNADLLAGKGVGDVPPSVKSIDSIEDTNSTSTTAELEASIKQHSQKAEDHSRVVSDGKQSERKLTPDLKALSTVVSADTSASTVTTRELGSSSKLRRTRSTAKASASSVSSKSSSTSTAASVYVEAGPPEAGISVEPSDKQSEQGASERYSLKRPMPTTSTPIEDIPIKRPKIGEDPLWEESPDIETSGSVQSETASTSAASMEPGPLLTGPGKQGRKRGGAKVRASRSASIKSATSQVDATSNVLAGPPTPGLSLLTRLDTKGAPGVCKLTEMERDVMGSGGTSLMGRLEKSPAKCNLLKTSHKTGDPKSPISTHRKGHMTPPFGSPFPTLKIHSSTSKKSAPSHFPAPDDRGKPSVMFTGVVDKEGEKRLKALGGSLAENVYECTHLITDKVRRTVKFLCCLSRGCVIVNDNWLKVCHKTGCFLLPEEFSVQDKSMEKQYNFSLAKSLELARSHPLLTGYTVYMTPNIKPSREQMSDIIISSGGEPAHFRYPLPRAPKILVLSCEEDMELCRECIDGGQLVHMVELILGGVLRQQLDLSSNLLIPPKHDKKPAKVLAARKSATRTPKQSPRAVSTRSSKSPSKTVAKSPKCSTKLTKSNRSPKSPTRSPAPPSRRGKSKAQKVSSTPAKKSVKRPAKEPAQAASKRRKKN